MKQQHHDTKPIQTDNPDRKNPNKPEIRDNLDSRKNEEQDFKGDDVTHNEKQTKENHLKKNKE